jgi:hypothetical protein
MNRVLLFIRRVMVRKKVLNRRAVIVASSLAAIPLTAILIAAATHRGKRKSLQTRGFLGETDQKLMLLLLHLLLLH